MDIVIRKLEKHLALTEEEKAALRQAFNSAAAFKVGEDVGSAGETVTFVGALLKGHLCRQVTFRDGSRQLLGLPVAGDTIEMQSASLDRMDHSVTALTPCTVAIASKVAIQTLVEAHPRLTALLRRSVAVEASVSRQWVSSLGRRSAHGRLAHLFCELFVRMADAGLTEGSSYAMPLTQASLADASGLSVVHVNRVLQQLRDERLIRFRRGVVSIGDWDGLAEAGGFDPAYLHLHEVYRPPSSPLEAGHGSRVARRALAARTGTQLN